mgnify:FL=1
MESASIKKSRAKNPLWNKGRTSIQGQALYVRSARLTARTMEVRAVLRHFVPNKGLHPLRLRLFLRTCHLETVLTNHFQTTNLKIEHITRKQHDRSHAVPTKIRYYFLTPPPISERVFFLHPNAWNLWQSGQMILYTDIIAAKKIRWYSHI